MKKKYIAIFIISLLISLFVACEFNNGVTETESEKNICKVSFSLSYFETDSSSRTVLPTSLNNETFVLTCMSDKTGEETEYRYASATDLTKACISLEYGNWTFILKEYSNGLLYGTATQIVRINKQTTVINFNIKHTPDSSLEGSFSFTLNYPDDSKVRLAETKLFTLADMAECDAEINSTLETERYSCSSVADSGEYVLVINLWYNKEKTIHLGTWSEVIKVESGCISSKRATIERLSDKIVDASPWEYPKTRPVKTWEGSGTETDPYLISTTQQLADFAYLVNNTEYSRNWKPVAKLINNIDLNYGLLNDSDVSEAKHWIPIGYENSFQGIFDGCGNRIDGLYIDSSGLFSSVSGGTIKNLILGKGLIYNNSKQNKRFVMGGIAGTIKDNSIISNCTNEELQVLSLGDTSPNFSETSTYIGGIVGRVDSSSSIINCKNKGKIKDNQHTGLVGGIAGYCEGVIYNCCNFSEVIGNNKSGGIVGSVTNLTRNCFNAGEITGTKYSGGIAGFLYNSTNLSYLVGNCYNTGILKGDDYIGGIIGFLSSGGIGECYFKTDCGATNFTGNTTSYSITACGSFLTSSDIINKTYFSGNLGNCLNDYVGRNKNSIPELAYWVEGPDGWPVLSFAD